MHPERNWNRMPLVRMTNLHLEPGEGSLEELIAANMTIEEITQAVGADTLGYLTLDGMLESVPGGPAGFCHACFSGDYPTPPPADPEKLRFGCGC